MGFLRHTQPKKFILLNQLKGEEQMISPLKLFSVDKVIP